MLRAIVILALLLSSFTAYAGIVITQDKSAKPTKTVLNEMELVHASDKSAPYIEFTLEHMRFSSTNKVIVTGAIRNTGSGIYHAPHIFIEAKDKRGKVMCKRDMQFDNIYPGKEARLDNFEFYCPRGRPATVEYYITTN